MMDVGADQFTNDYYEFRLQIKELERRLASLLIQAFDDSSSAQARFKLLDSFDRLLERTNIESEIEKRYFSLVNAYGEDLNRNICIKRK